MTPAAPAPPAEALYPSRASAGSFLGRQLYQRYDPPVILLGVAPTGVEVAAAAAKAMSALFDVVIGAHIRLNGIGVVGAVAEDGDAVLDPDFSPRFGLMDALDEALDSARRAIKTERLLFRGPRPLRGIEGYNVVIVDGQITSPWKMLAAADVAQKLGAARVGIAAAVATQLVQERIRARQIDFLSPSVLLDAIGHARPFGDPEDASAERLRSIVVAREAA
jgi:predicted phosphoribosyltransferase